MTRRLAILAVTALLMWGVKRQYADAPADDLRWMLTPTSRLVSLATGVPFEWQSREGYFSRERMFLIAKACAGINFMIAAFGMTVFLLAARATTAASAGRIVIVSAAVSYAAAILVNAARISFALWLAAHPGAVTWLSAAQLHRAAGIACYFGGLLILYQSIRRSERATLAVPLAWYYAIAIVVPLLNGARGWASVRHMIVVFTLPLAFVGTIVVIERAARHVRSLAART